MTTMQRASPVILLALVLMMGIYWAMLPATSPTNDCGMNFHLRLDITGESPCDLGVVSAAEVSRLTKQRNAELDQTNPLPSEVSGFPVMGRIGAFDEIMAGFVKLFLRR